MDLLLLAITVVSLVLALFLGAAAWGMWREERARSAARVAALAAAADDEPAAQMPIQPAPAVAAAPRQAPWSAPPIPRPVADAERTDQHAHELGDTFLGSAVAAPSGGGRQRGLALAATVLFVALFTGAYLSLYGDTTSGGAAAAADTSPLELISLRHEREDGALAITGLVRNPANGARVEQLAAVIFLFDREGNFVTSARAGVDFTLLAPGDESPFVVRVEAPTNIARYRVSFRTDAGVVSHIDRRGETPVGDNAARTMRSERGAGRTAGDLP